MKITILTNTSKRNNYEHLYPLIKFKKHLNYYGYYVKISNNLKSTLNSSGNLIILESRAFQKWNKNKTIEIIEKLKKNYNKVFWYDTVDTSGSDSFFVMPYVNIFLKKQLLVDKFEYTINKYDKSVRCWIDYQDLPIHYEDYTPCKDKYIEKLKLGWNIGFNDYRSFNKIEKAWLFYFNINKSLFFSFPKINKEIDLTFRGSLSYNIEGSNNFIGEQRNKVIRFLKNTNKFNIITGNPIPYKKYIEELKNSKVSISPFGWGEICYRDFESILSGTLLLKSNMSHLETFPGIYKENLTYIPLKWDISDLEEKLEIILTNYSEYIEIAFNAQREYLNYIFSPYLFIEHFFRIVNY